MTQVDKLLILTMIQIILELLIFEMPQFLLILY